MSANLDQIALDTATAIMALYFKPIPGMQLKAKIQCAVRDAMNKAAPYDQAMNARRYQYVRTLHPDQYARLCAENIAGKGKFDDLVDADIAKRRAA